MQLNTDLLITGRTQQTGVSDFGMNALQASSANGTLQYNTDQNKYFYHNGTEFTPIDTVFERMTITGTVPLVDVITSSFLGIKRLEIAPGASIDFGTNNYRLFNQSNNSYAASVTGLFTNTFTATLVVDMFRRGTTSFLTIKGIPKPLMIRFISSSSATAVTNFNSGASGGGRGNPVFIDYDGQSVDSDFFTWDSATREVVVQKPCRVEILLDLRLKSTVNNTGVPLYARISSRGLVGQGSVNGGQAGKIVVTIPRGAAGIDTGYLNASFIKTYNPGDRVSIGIAPGNTFNNSDPIVLDVRNTLVFRVFQTLDRI